MDIHSLFGVRGKVVLVTGGSRGIGKMIATGFIRNGCRVYISARSAKDCDATAAELSALGPGVCVALPADLQKLGEVDRLVEAVSQRETVLNVLVNNAGATWGEDIDTYPDKAWTKLLTLNVQRVFTLTQKLLPLLRRAAEQGGKEEAGSYKDPARVINIGSINGERVPGMETYAYAASKAALHQLSRHLALRLGGEGITSNVLACGPFESKMMAHTLATAKDVIVSGVPLARIGTPEDVAGACLFLSSRAGAYITGATIAVDGGHLVHTNSKL
ncbi:NAD(P)-binding protein [Calocera cornea HHB12733]|uniref:NAD(P)-binding protein n=1 Tax=Calocera cornea HHB12733 TaxID=1353952 RepID=A0A165FQS1_9BASI|nr:NAD(P)-binding protein [Calocera cornea HHB12733]